VKLRCNILIMCVVAILAIALGNMSMVADAKPVDESCQGALASSDRTSSPVDEEGMVLNAPLQLPVVVPTQAERQLQHAQSRTLPMRPHLLRRFDHRLCCNVYAPLAPSGRMIIERESVPLRQAAQAQYYVITLCRLLC